MQITRVFIVSAFALSIACFSAGVVLADGLEDMCVVFVGASITEAWDFNTYFSGYDFHKVIHYSPNKPEVWDEVVAYNPDIVTFKQCGTYYDEGGDTDLPWLYDIAEEMVGLIQGIDAIPVPATTLPIDPGYGSCTQAQLDDIIEYNEWIRNYCSTNGLVCMEYYDQIADEDGQLPYEYHVGDGLHLNEAGYTALSPIVVPTLDSCIGIQVVSMGSIKALFN